MSTQPWFMPSLFADTAGPVRPTDPDTSAEAASIPGKAALRLRVLRALVLHGPMHDERIAEVLDETARKGSVIKRRTELVGNGLVRVHEVDGVKQYARTSLGSRSLRWDVTPEGRRKAWG